MELTTFEISMLTFMGILLIKIIHNMYRIEKLHRGIKKNVKQNNNLN